ncbi:MULTISPECIES: hypothetical protein [Bacillus subtilis group]|nr:MULTISPECIES: hypothetical protein [Bacillus subtilis group]EQM28573.1 hypothetical protein N399_08045 [Bacillus licheniformis CG-B52]TWK63174.1 hypothetical protein CHCC20342_3046 [Bacillus licheniformis]TWL69365.1 hypothetical protein CHCC15318_2107 [Bacillus licheniformis]TWM26892.1 hypothetical protein CHCC14821_3006 [Bacillus paralicheniformis]
MKKTKKNTRKKQEKLTERDLRNLMDTNRLSIKEPKAGHSDNDKGAYE